MTLSEYDHIRMFKCDVKITTVLEVLKEFKKGSTVVDPLPTIRVKFDYPLKYPIIAEFTRPQGWSITDFIEVIATKYKEIYEEEDITGEYGIWGHGIGDLWLEGFSKGEDGVYQLDIGS